MDSQLVFDLEGLKADHVRRKEEKRAAREQMLANQLELVKNTLLARVNMLACATAYERRFIETGTFEGSPPPECVTRLELSFFAPAELQTALESDERFRQFRLQHGDQFVLSHRQFVYDRQFLERQRASFLAERKVRESQIAAQAAAQLQMHIQQFSFDNCYRAYCKYYVEHGRFPISEEPAECRTPRIDMEVAVPHSEMEKHCAQLRSRTIQIAMLHDYAPHNGGSNSDECYVRSVYALVNQSTFDKKQ